MTIRKNLLLSVVVGLGSFFPLLTITKPAEAQHTHCAVVPYSAPASQETYDSVKTEFSYTAPINVTAANTVNCPGSKIGNYEISDLTSISLALSATAKGTWKVRITSGPEKELFFSNGNSVQISLSPHPRTDAFEFDATDGSGDNVEFIFTPVSVEKGTNILKVQNLGGNHYYQEVPEPLTILGTGVVLGAIPVLKKEYAKRNKKKNEDA